MNFSFRQRKNTIMLKLVRAFAILIILSTLLVGAISYKIAENLIRDKVSNLSMVILQQTNGNIDKIINEIIALSDLYVFNKDIISIMRTDPEDISDEKWIESMGKFNSMNITYSKTMHFITNDVTIIGSNGKVMISWTSDEEDLDKYLKYLNDSGMLNALKEQGLGKVWTGTHEDVRTYTRDKYCFSLISHLIDIENRVVCGTVLVNIPENNIGNLLQKVAIERDTEIYVLDRNNSVLSSTNKQTLGKDFSSSSYFNKILDNDSGNFIEEIDGNKVMIIFDTVKINGWKIVEILKYDNIMKEINTLKIFVTSAVFICMITFMVISYSISSKITGPIKKLKKCMLEVEKGNFDTVLDLKTNDEIEELNNSFNVMVKKISNMIYEIKEKEKEKRLIEFEVLRAQVNPHFLFNTLNSVKWLASINKVYIIRDIVSALGRLLENSIGKGQDIITVEEEISLLKDYIIIQKIRYGNSFCVEYKVAEDALKCKIVKFVLQPIVENSIIHAFKDTNGSQVIVDVVINNGNLCLHVSDNGVGMSQEKAEQVLKNESKGRFNNIGIKNVHERIKMIFGEEYGLSIESSEGSGTKVTITVPVQY